MRYEVGQKVRVLDKTRGTAKERSGSWKAMFENGMTAIITNIYKDEGECWVELRAHKDSQWEGEYSLNDIAPLNSLHEADEL